MSKGVEEEEEQVGPPTVRALLASTLTLEQ